MHTEIHETIVVTLLPKLQTSLRVSMVSADVINDMTCVSNHLEWVSTMTILNVSI